MKNLLTATMPALALLALGGCATSGALTTSTETDGVYYSSSDRTTAVTSPAPMAYGYGSQGTIPARALDDTTPAATTDDANPDYQGGTTQNGYATGTDYYSNSYNSGLSYYNPSGFNQPYTGPGVSSYSYAPAYGASPSYYGSPYGYSSAFGLGYSPFGYGVSPFMSYGYSPFGYGYPYGGAGFYDPFYAPFGYGSGLSIGFGFGYGGFGGFGYPYGYGYSPFGFGSPYGYAGGYGYRGYGYGYGPEYARPIIYTRGAGVSSPGAGAVLYGSRSNRGGAVMNPSMNAAGNPNTVNLGGRPGAGSYTGNATAMPGGANTGMPAGPRGRGGRAVSFGDATGQPAYSTPAPQGNGNATATPNPNATSGGRRGFFGGFFGNGNGNANATTNPAGQSANPNMGTSGGRQRGGYSSYGQGQQSMQPQPMQRSYSQPQRTYSQPQQPTFSQPSRSFGGGNFGGGGGGGSFGGGGGGGGGRGRR
jgi:hypothetical protein